MSFITAIVVAFDSAHALPDCLGALREAGVPTIVVDNASEDGSAGIAADYGATIIRNARNEGYGRANNIGARASESEFLLVLNPDVVVEPGTVAALLEAARRYPECALLRAADHGARRDASSSSLVRSLRPTSRTRRELSSSRRAMPACPFASGACFLVRRDLFLRLGGFDEQIFLFYEDDDLCRRIADASPALVYVPAAVVRHGRGRSSASRPGRVFRSRWHQAWSRAYVSRKYQLSNPAPSMFAVNALKSLGAACSSAARSWSAMAARRRGRGHS